MVSDVPRNNPHSNRDSTGFPASELRAQAEQVRVFVRAKVLRDLNKEPSQSGNVMAHPPFVRITGALFFDDSHVGDQPRGKKGTKVATLWELHPVTVIEFASPPQ